MSALVDRYARHLPSALLSLEHAVRQLTRPSHYSLLLGSPLDIARRNARLVAENVPYPETPSVRQLI